MRVEGESLFQQRGRHPDDGSEQQVLRLPTQLRAIPNSEHLVYRQDYVNERSNDFEFLFSF